VRRMLDRKALSVFESENRKDSFVNPERWRLSADE